MSDMMTLVQAVIQSQWPPTLVVIAVLLAFMQVKFKAVDQRLDRIDARLDTVESGLAALKDEVHANGKQIAVLWERTRHLGPGPSIPAEEARAESIAP